VDIAILPEELVQQVDIVTGGASAAYGSDAVAGVVNFVLDTEFTGLKGLLQGGVTHQGDNLNQKVSATYGTPIGDQLHLIVSGSFYNADGVEDYRDRDWFQSCAPLMNPSPPPVRVQQCGARTPIMAEGGLITSGPLAGTQFLAGGVPAPFEYGTFRTPTMMIGGSGEDQGLDFQPMPELRRMTGFAHLSYEPTENITLFADALLAQSKTRFRGTRMQFYGATAFTIFQDNAFLPASIREQMAARNLASIPLASSMPATGILDNRGISDTQRYSTGLAAEFGDWNVDAYYTHGTNLQTIRAVGNVTLAHVFDAVDAVRDPATGNIVCRTVLSNPGHSCVPYNVFGPDSASPEAVAFLRNGPGGEGSWTEERTKQDVVEVAIRGEPFDTWAGPLGVAFGGGYRSESVEREVDPGSNGPKISCLQVDPNCANPYPIPRGVPSSYLARPVGAYFFSNQQPITGGYDLWEAFGEALVPLARDVRFIQSLDLNAAVRYTDYSLSGGVTTWKVGLTWQPSDEIRFRATRSRDIRAPNLTELYSSSAAGATSVTDPTRGNAVSTVVSLASGNEGLVPETADTFTIGAVLSPNAAPGLRFSIDYYNIDITDAVGQLGLQNIVDQCAAGSTDLCSRIERDSEGVIFRVNNGFLNIARSQTSGLDFEGSYRTSIGSDTLGLRLLASHVFELSTEVPGTTSVDRAGQTGTSGGIPGWSFYGDITYQAGPLTLSLNERVISAGTYNATYVEGRDIDDNKVPAIAYTDLTASYDFEVAGNEWQVFGTINNLLDQAPPKDAGQFFVFGTIPSNSYLFDAIGRAYTLGLRIRM
jgi:outer membrane receptor protein involved in Fe transport